MTDRTQPEALRLAAWLNEGAWHQMRLGDVEAAGRELRRQHTRIAELEAQIEALSGVQALSAAPEAIAKLRHLYQNMVNGAVRDTASAKRIAEGLLAPAIEALERATPPAEQQAQPDECFPGEPKVAVPHGLIGAACFAIRNKRDGGKVLEQLRRYSVGDRSQPLTPQQEEPVATLHCNDVGYVWARATEVGKLMWFEQPLNLYTAPQPAPDCHHRPPCDECAALAAQGGKDA